jgi:dihydrodipicolinate synthase/N-acetylneuraminate lyase
MNIAKIKEALADAIEAKEHAEADGNSDYAYWQGYEEGILMALAQIEEKVL